jgi:hypothetical protein
MSGHICGTGQGCLTVDEQEFEAMEWAIEHVRVSWRHELIPCLPDESHPFWRRVWEVYGDRLIQLRHVEALAETDRMEAEAAAIRRKIWRAELRGAT